MTPPVPDFRVTSPAMGGVIARRPAHQADSRPVVVSPPECPRGIARAGCWLRAGRWAGRRFLHGRMVRPISLWVQSQRMRGAAIQGRGLIA